MTFVLEEPRVLVCGSRAWPRPAVVHAALDRLLERYGDRLVVIEGRTTGADAAAHDWCEQHNSAWTGIAAIRSTGQPSGAGGRRRGGRPDRSAIPACCLRSGRG